MFGMASWLIVWRTSDPSEKSDSSERLSQMDGAGSGGGKAVSAGGPMELSRSEHGGDAEVYGVGNSTSRCFDAFCSE